MAIYRLSAKIITRSQGQSAIACAAYRAGEKLYDERTGELYDFTKKQDVAFSEILLPKSAPEWMQDRQTLWNTVELTEKRKDSQLAREVQLALPRELTLSQNIELTREFVNDKFVGAGMVADINIHIPKASDGELQPHAHVLLTMREITEEGFGLKMREWNQKCELEAWREEWAGYANKHLAMNGYDIQIDHRSLHDQGIDLIPQKKIGPTGLFHRMASYEEQLENDRLNGKKLLARPEIAFDVLTHQQSTFTHHDMARIVNRYTVDSDQFLVVYEKVKASPELVSLGLDDKNRERFTTKDMLALESEMVANSLALHGKTDHGLANVSTEAIATQHTLSKEQHHAFDYLVSPGDLKNVVGYAGTGKSRLLGAAREAWEASGYRVLGATLSGVAAENLETSSGIESRTLASRSHYWGQGKELLASNDILVIDEAGMLGTRQLAEVMDEVKRQGAKVVLIGDPQEQLQAIEAGAAFRGIIQHTSEVKLTDIWRQQVDWQKEATVQFSTRQTAAGLASYAAHGNVHAFNTQKDAIDALVAAWNEERISQPDKSQILLAYTRDAVKELNMSARALRQSLGELGTDHPIHTERGERLFAEGEKIYFLKNDRDLNVKNGSLGTLTHIDGNTLTVSIEKEDANKSYTVQFSTENYNHLDYGYTATIHKGQGGTFDHSFLLASHYLDRHSTNVAMTRHREGIQVFWSKQEFQSLHAMMKRLSRDGAKDLALDYINEEFDKASFASYRGLDTLWESFWDKYGAEWLERIQDTLSSWVDGAKSYVEVLQEQIGKVLSHEKDEQDKVNNPLPQPKKTVEKNDLDREIDF